MPRRILHGAWAMAEKVDWADPGYFSGESRIGNSVRVLVQLVRPPRGHRTLPTKAGILLILITIGVGTAAFNTGQNILYLALSMLLSTLLVSGLLSWANFKGCRWRLDVGRHFRVGEGSPVHLEIHNTKTHLPSYSLTFKVATSESGQEHALCLRERLDPDRKAKMMWEFIPRKRGKESILLKGLASRYPFGFLKKSITDSYSKEIVVWPERILYQFSGDKAGRRWQYGHHRRKGDGVELIHLREYKSGDPLRRIHWKASARMGKLQVRETEQEHHQAFSLCINPDPGIWSGEDQFERMCSFAATLAEDLYQHDQLKSTQVMGKERILIGAIEDLYTFLDQLGELKFGQKEEQVPLNPVDKEAIRFIPGPAGTVVARIEEDTIGQA